MIKFVIFWKQNAKSKEKTIFLEETLFILISDDKFAESIQITSFYFDIFFLIIRTNLVFTIFIQFKSITDKPTRLAN